jgi:hypothetical protein
MKNFEEKGPTDRMLLLEYLLNATVQFVMCRIIHDYMKTKKNQNEKSGGYRLDQNA